MGSGAEVTWPPQSTSKLALRGSGNLGTPALRVAFCPCEVVLEGSDLGLELLEEQLQLLLFTKDVVMLS